MGRDSLIKILMKRTKEEESKQEVTGWKAKAKGKTSKKAEIIMRKAEDRKSSTIAQEQANHYP